MQTQTCRHHKGNNTTKEEGKSSKYLNLKTKMKLTNFSKTKHATTHPI